MSHKAVLMKKKSNNLSMTKLRRYMQGCVFLQLKTIDISSGLERSQDQPLDEPSGDHWLNFDEQRFLKIL
jgi:hypothetical protein